MWNVPKISLEQVQVARQQLQGVVQITPLDASQTLSDLYHGPVYLKLENLQKTGSFKLRGAFNKITNLTTDARQRGVIAASAGNHAQGVAFAAAYHRIPCTIVMPESASLAKIAATEHYGATVVLSGESYDEAYAHAKLLQAQYGYTFVHAFDDADVVAGQATVGLEILEQLPTAGAIIVPLGGGGLVTGIGAVVKQIRPDIQIIGVEAAAVACFRHALDTGLVETIPSAPTLADGIAVRRPGDLTFALAEQVVDEVVTVEEEEIARAMVLLLERCKVVAEGAAAAAVAAVTQRKIQGNPSPAVVVVSGGNVDVTVLSRIIEHGLSESGRYLGLTVTLADRPGSLQHLLSIFAGLRANVLSVSHHRLGARIPIGQTEVEIDLETRDQRHIQHILQMLQQHGYRVISHS